MLALGLMFVLPTAGYAQYTRQDRRDQRREERREQRREERREQRRGRDWGDYNGWGGSSQLRQTALNAGYNEGIKEGRKDRNRRGGYRNPNDFSAYRNATKDYNSRYGDRALYQRFYRQGFENGYRDGLNGY